MLILLTFVNRNKNKMLMKQKNCKMILGIFVLTFLVNGQIAWGQSTVPATQENASAQAVQTNTQPATTNTTVPTAQTKTTPVTTNTVTSATPNKTAPVAQKANVVYPAQLKPGVKPAAPQAAPKPVAPAVAKVNTAQPKVGPPVDYIKRVLFVHNLVCKRIPQKLIDSIASVNHFMLDTIRQEIASHRDKDSISFLKTALTNGTNDSLTLINLNVLVNSAEGNGPLESAGSINAYCIDLTTQAPMDSVKVSVYNHDSLIATAYSTNDGFCKITGLKPDEYSLGFFKNNYTPFSDRWVKVTANNVTYLEMPLTETPRFYLPRFSMQIWAIILVGIVSVFILIYSIIRRLGRVA